MNQNIINSELRKLIAQFAKAQSLPVAWPNVQFDKTDGNYLQFHVMPAEPVNISMGLDMVVYRGVLQINIVGKTGKGEADLMLIAERLSNVLVNGENIGSGIYLNGEPNIFNGIQDGSTYTIPVSVPYRCDSIRK